MICPSGRSDLIAGWAAGLAGKHPSRPRHPGRAQYLRRGQVIEWLIVTATADQNILVYEKLPLTCTPQGAHAMATPLGPLHPGPPRPRSCQAVASLGDCER